MGGCAEDCTEAGRLVEDGGTSVASGSLENSFWRVARLEMRGGGPGGTEEGV